MKVDPTTLGIVGPSLIAIAEEMGAVLVRSAHSAIVSEAKDGTTVLLSPQGEVVAQSEYIPIFVNAFSEMFQAVTEVYPVDTLRPGDLLLTNDPYNGGQHHPDIMIISPVYYEGALIAFGGSVAHHLDMGGVQPGHNPQAIDVYQGGLLVPPLKIQFQEVENSFFARLLRLNVRMPEHTIGDLDAQLASIATGERRLLELAKRYGADTLLACMEEILNISEAKTRAQIQAIPEGTYYGQEVLDGAHGELLNICAIVTIRGSDIEVDYEGTSAQCNEAALNASFASTISGTCGYFKSILTGSGTPGNDGCNRPIKVKAPKGSLLNPYPPAPIAGRMMPICRATDAIARALSDVVPELITAPGVNAVLSVRFSKRDPITGAYHVFAETQGGSFGGGAGYDGEDALAVPLTNVANVPVERVDAEVPFIRVVRYELNRGSAGHGEYRGGMGISRTFEILEDGVTFIWESNRLLSQPWGLRGGGSGRSSRFFVEREGETIPLYSMGVFNLQKGDRLTLSTGGGGGYGPPEARDREKVRREVEQGFLTPEDALYVYNYSLGGDDAASPTG
jgi:N-methylhydantoinase B